MNNLRQSRDTRPCRGCVLYGIDGSTQAIKAAYAPLTRLFTDLSISIDRVTVRAPGYGKVAHSYENASRRLRLGDWEQVQFYEFVAMQPNETRENEHWSAKMMLSRMEDRYVSFFALTDVSPTYNVLSASLWRETIAALRPAYGISFGCCRQQGPEYYALGMILGRTSLSAGIDERLLRIGRWSDMGMTNRIWEQGILRDIYPQNLLTAPHLRFRVGGTAFAEWVAADSSRGRLSDSAGGMTLWEVSDQAREQIGPELLAARMLFNPYDETWDTFRVMFPEP